MNDFTFEDDIYDSEGNVLNMGELFDVYIHNDINFGVNGESVKYMKSVIPYVSRNFVLATPEQFIYHLKRLNMFSKVNAYFSQNVVTLEYNLGEYIKNLDNPIQNRIRELHNIADETPAYGIKLYEFLQKMASTGNIDEKEVDKIYILSVNWPNGVKI